MQQTLGSAPEQFVDGQRAADFLGMPRKTLLNMARQGFVPAYPIGDGQRHIWRFRLSELADWAQSKTVKLDSHRGRNEREFS